MRLAKILATLGPASNSPEMIRALIEAGANLFRLNFSHGDHATLREVVQRVRHISQEMNTSVALLGDLQGPKFRVGEFEDHKPILLEKDAIIRFTAEKTPGNAKKITTNTPQIVEDLRVGDEVLLADGLMALEVTERISEHEILCKVLVGGLLGEKKGINVPGITVSKVAALTEKDRADALFALEQDLDFLALSFVRCKEDIVELRQFLEENRCFPATPPMIVAKIEKPQALDDLDGILETSDAIMVARGDLGVELKAEKVPVIQKQLIQMANQAQKPVITATQMLESMIQFPTATRAEVSDVANAIFDGSDCLMLSAETAAGKYPVEAVQTMARIIREAEEHLRNSRQRYEREQIIEESMQEDSAIQFHQAIAQSAVYAGKCIQAKGIVVVSFSGSMARRISKRKPLKPIVAVTPHRKVCRQLSLLWGVYPFKITAYQTGEEIVRHTEEMVLAAGLIQKNDPVVLCAGKTHLAGMSNSLSIYAFGDILTQLAEQRREAELLARPLT